MNQPSDYEREAWTKVKTFRSRPLTRIGQGTGEKVAEGAAFVADKVGQFVGDHPQAQTAIAKVKKGGQAIRDTAIKVVDLVPDEATDWAGQAVHAVQKTTAKISRAGLSPKQMVKKHRKRGHDVTRLSELRTLDLEQIDTVRGRGASWYYPAAAALSGVGAGLAISGGEIVVVAGAGAAFAPAGAVVAGAIAGDAALVLGMASRSIGQIALHYGYDPEDPKEKLFILSAINLGTAMSTSAKAAALADISRLTQALIRGKSWALLNKHAVAKVASNLAPKFGFRLTKQSLGKVVPIAGIVIGGTMNWATLEAIVDAADISYRRRFLLDKYPQLDADGDIELMDDDAQGDADIELDEPISVLDELDRASEADGDTRQVR